jgi:cytochrome c
MLNPRSISHPLPRYVTLVLLVVGALLLAACAAPAAPTAKPAAGKPPAAGATAPAAGAANVDQGKQLMQSKGCVACHTTPGIAGGTNVGPALAGFASRPQIAGVLENNPANLRRWLQNPPAVKPGTQMPSLGLSADEVEKLSAFLETLK